MTALGLTECSQLGEVIVRLGFVDAKEDIHTGKVSNDSHVTLGCDLSTGEAGTCEASPHPSNCSTVHF